MFMSNKKRMISFLAIGIFVFGVFSIVNPYSVQAKGGMTVKANISMSNAEDDPSVNNSIQTIKLTFSEPLDSSSITGKVKIYKIDANGKRIEEPCVVRVDSAKPTIININNKKIEKFAEGQEYKIVISSDIKSTTGITMGKNFIGYFATNYTFSLANATESNSIRSQIVVISDLHLGVDDAFAELKNNKQALVDFLNQIKNSPKVKELVIAGDLFDGWFLPMDFVMPSIESTFWDRVAANNKTVVEAFNAIIRAGEIKVTYVPGNHDLLLTKADVDRVFPGINQARDDVQGLGTYTTGPNSEIAIEHGHKYNFFCAPDQISNRDITNNTTSILPPGYFFTRIAASSVIEGHPATSNLFPNITPNIKNDSQLNAFVYWNIWKTLMTVLPVNEKFADKVIKTNVDGFKLDYAINDLIPQLNAGTGNFDMNLYKGIQDTWDARQTQNGVKVKIPTKDAIAKASDNPFTDSQAKTQIFDCDASKRIVVFGHTHVAEILPMSNLQDEKTIYANSGTWIDNAQGYPTMTFVVVTPPKAGTDTEFVNLYKYSADKTITQWEDAQAITNR
jgi:UDP-2,3-diacylglucosamine pyrophosphatase LpxH